jgi:transcriptional regulator with GAF, ATPase, and Fis domain
MPIPPKRALRDRKEDIPELTRHFIDIYSQKAGKKITGIADDALDLLLHYHWPGNIRELEHLIERSVLLAKGSTIENILPPSLEARKNIPGDEYRLKTIDENERDHIIAVLKICNGRVWGRGAAAEILNINPSTLKSRMRKLGIKRIGLKKK